jgi:hypothetical protein
MAKQKYYRLDRIIKENAKYLFLLGERSNGKSYAVKEYILKKAFDKKDCTFGLIWRYEKDIKEGYITDYFADMPINEITRGAYDHVIAYHGSIYFAKEDVETGKLEKGLMCGKYFALNISVRYKSKSFPMIEDLVFEEIMVDSNSSYLQNEVSLFMQLLSTVFRRRENSRVFMIGNTLSRVCPYVTEFGLKNILKMIPGDMDVYEFKTLDDQITKIAVEYCENSTGGGRTGLFFGKFAKNIECGLWQCSEHPKLSLPYEECDIVYKLTLKNGDFAFNVDLLFQYDDPYVFVYPSKEGRYRDRIITDEFADNSQIDNQLHIQTNKAESLIHRCYLLNKFVYSDNLTGEDFMATIKTFAKNPL